jgi:N-acetylglucosaminyldiphosphoundecaprenol N-acetyl-beta-D-mannosaminyltransferase
MPIHLTKPFIQLNETPPLPPARTCGKVLGVQIDALSWKDAVERLLAWAGARESRYVTICNVHVVVSASRDAAYRDVINGSDMATPDGAPVAWMLRRQGLVGQPRISGPDLMWVLCEHAARETLPMYFYGSTEATLALLDARLRAAFPGLRIAMESPPFRALTVEEDAATVDRINASGAGIVFVGLGCPKQERWMAEHRGRVNAVMIGVGAAFDFHAGTVRRAPAWMRDNGLEWLHRLLSEPGRLWKRYLVTNTLFILGAARQLLGGK